MNLKDVIKYILATISNVVPRDSDLWITGKISKWEYDNNPPIFFDNSKYFYLYLVNETNEKVFWLSDSEQEYKMLKNMDLPVVKLKSIKGIWLILRAKYSFHHYGTDQIDKILQYGSIQIDFWHGTPLKKIRYDVVPKKKDKPNKFIAFLNKEGCEYVSSTSAYLSNTVLEHAFAVKNEQMLNYGYPRMDILKYDKDNMIDFCKKYSKTLLPYINRTKDKKVFLYMPTWRDDDPCYFSKAKIDFEKLNKELEKNNSVFFLKLHPLTKDVRVDQYDNIIQIANDVDIYPFLVFVDYLITDYSSIYFDFLPLDREIIFIPYDYQNYIEKRPLYFDYNEVTPGIKYNSFEEFSCNICKVEELDYSAERRIIRERFIENYNFDACKNIYNFFKKQF